MDEEENTNEQTAKAYEVPFVVMYFDKQDFKLAHKDESKKEDEIENIVFADPTFFITCSFHNNDGTNNDIGIITKTKGGKNDFFKQRQYTALFKQNVYWDFGDGHIVRGATARHSYDKAGRYTISCSFLDKNNKSYKNSYEIIVSVIEPIKLSLSEYTEESSNPVSTNCGKITKVCTLEGTLSNKITYELPIVPYRKHTTKEVKNFFDNEEGTITTKRKFYSFYTGEGVDPFLDDESKKTKISFQPVLKFVPTYQNIYGYFQSSSRGLLPSISLNLATVINTPKVKNCWKEIEAPKIARTLEKKSDGDSIKSEAKTVVQYTKNPIRVYQSIEELPPEYHFIGKRTFVDVYYMNDYVSEDTISFTFDLESKQAFNDLYSSTNYANMIPVEKKVTINETENAVSYAFTTDTFIRGIENSCGDCDVYFPHSFVYDKEQTFYVVPYVKYTQNDFGVSEVSPEYYVPKDVDLSKGVLSSDSSISIEPLDTTNTPWLKKSSALIPKDSTNKQGFQFSFKTDSSNASATVIPVDLDSVVLPQKKKHNEDIDRLIDNLTHSAQFNNATLVKEALKAIFGNKNWLNETITKMDMFYDDNNNPDTCYVTQLISLLRSMNEQTEEYQNDFSMVNELNELTRILSMEHSLLVGHEVSKPMDISFDGEYKGANVGKEIFPNTVLSVNDKGLYTGDKDENNTPLPDTKIIVWERHTKQSKIVDFYKALPQYYDSGTNKTSREYKIVDYEDSWGWDLVLPEYFDAIGDDDREQHLRSLFRFFVLKNPTNTAKLREGNFLEDSSIKESKVEEVESWEEDWGCRYNFLMKLLHSHA